MTFSCDPKLEVQRTLVECDFESAYHNLLNAQGATDLLCLNNSVHSILTSCDREKVLRAIATATSLYEYYATLSSRLQQRMADIA